MSEEININFEYNFKKITDILYDKETNLSNMDRLIPLCRLAKKMSKELWLALVDENKYRYSEMIGKIQAQVSKWVYYIHDRIKYAGELEMKWSMDDGKELKDRINDLSKMAWFDDLQ